MVWGKYTKLWAEERASYPPYATTLETVAILDLTQYLHDIPYIDKIFGMPRPEHLIRLVSLSH